MLPPLFAAEGPLLPLPPGPRLPLQIVSFARDTPSFFRRCIEQYGDPCTIRLPAGNIVVTASPEGSREVFTAPPEAFEPFSRSVLQPLVGDNSVLLLAGARHKRERQLLMPPFHGERMRAYGHIIQQISLRHAAALRPGEPLVAQQLTQAISLEVIIQALFGVQQEEHVQRHRDTMVGFIDSVNPTALMIPALRRSFFGLGPWARLQQHYLKFDRLLQQELESRREQAEGREDILSLLLSLRDEGGRPLSDEELKDELRTLLVAGHETTALGLAWALYWVHRQPEVKQRLEQELAPLGPRPSPEELARLPYLGAVCDETLRIHPLLTLVSRKTVAPFPLRGRELPAGVGIMVAICLIHADAQLYPEPSQFRPERFLERKYTPFEYMPFGGGARRCLGAAFALYEMKVVLGSLLAAHRFRRTSERPERPVRRNLTFGPERGVELIYEGPRGLD